MLGLPRGLIAGFAPEYINIQKEKRLTKAKAMQEAANKRDKELTRLYGIYTPEFVSKTGMTKEDLVSAGIPINIAEETVYGAKGLIIGEKKKAGYDAFKETVKLMAKGDISLPNPANLIRILASPNASKKEKESAMMLITRIKNFDWFDQTGQINFQAFATVNADKYKNKQRQAVASQLDDEDMADLYADFPNNPKIGEHLKFRRGLLNDIEVGGDKSTTDLNIAHMTFLSSVEHHLSTLLPAQRKVAFNNNHLKRLVTKSVDYLRGAIKESVINGVEVSRNITDSDIFKTMKHIPNFVNNISKKPSEEKSIERISSPLTPKEKKQDVLYKKIPHHFNEILKQVILDNGVSNALRIDPDKIPTHMYKQKSTITGNTFEQDINLKNAYEEWFKRADPTNTFNLIKALTPIVRGDTQSLETDLADGVLGIAQTSIISLNPYGDVLRDGQRWTRKNSKFHNFKLANLYKGHSHRKAHEKFIKEELSALSIVTDIDNILTLTTNPSELVFEGKTTNITPPAIGYEAKYGQLVEDWKLKITAGIKVLKDTINPLKEKSFQNEHLSDENKKRQGYLHAKMKSIETKLASRNVSNLYRRRAIIQFRKLALTYRLSGLVQGETTGGRTISNQDFEVMYKALWGSKAASLARLQALKDKIVTMKTFATANKRFLEEGVYGVLSDSSGGRMYSLRTALITHFNKRYSDIDKKFGKEDEPAMAESRRVDERGLIASGSAKDYYSFTHKELRRYYGNLPKQTKDGSIDIEGFIEKREDFVNDAFNSITPEIATEIANDIAKIRSASPEAKEIALRLRRKRSALKTLGKDWLEKYNKTNWNFFFHPKDGRDMQLIGNLIEQRRIIEESTQKEK